MDDPKNDDNVIIIPVGSKLRRQRGSMMRESVSAPVSTFARTQLERMGWTEGTGLGKRQDGITTHIKVKQRKEASGIGSEQVAAVVQQQQVQDLWWLDSLGSTLAKLGGGGGNIKDNPQPRRVTDEELFVATGGARFGMRAGKTRNLDKWKRVDDTTTTRTTTTTTSTTCTSTTTAQRQVSDDAAAVNEQQQLPPNPTKKKKKRKADENSTSEDVENVNNDQEKSRKRIKKEKKPKKEKKMMKDKKREKRKLSL
jgi:Pin2-interacting protein X1